MVLTVGIFLGERFTVGGQKSFLLLGDSTNNSIAISLTLLMIHKSNGRFEIEFNCYYLTIENNYKYKIIDTLLKEINKFRQKIFLIVIEKKVQWNKIEKKC